MLADDIIKKLRLKQANIIKDSNSSVSFSAVISDELRKCMK